MATRQSARAPPLVCPRRLLPADNYRELQTENNHKDGSAETEHTASFYREQMYTQKTESYHVSEIFACKVCHDKVEWQAGAQLLKQKCSGCDCSPVTGWNDL